MTIAYWIVAALLALFYLYSGGIKLFRTKEQLRPMMAWVDTIPTPALRTIGALEVAGALGIVLPPLTGIAPNLAVAAAIGLALIQLGGIALHLRRGEARVLGLNAALLAAAVATAVLAALLR